MTGDGRVLGGSRLNLWAAYMQGASAYALAMVVGEELQDSLLTGGMHK